MGDTAAPWTVTDGGISPVPMPGWSQSNQVHINDPSAAAPSDKDLDFDPQGPGEMGVFVRHPWDASRADMMGNEAFDKTQQLYPHGDRHNNEADAFRHAYWNYNMAKAFGPDEARQFGNAHEIERPNSSDERYMDLYNNRVGRDLAASGQGDPISVVQSAVRRGLTRNRPFNGQ